MDRLEAGNAGAPRRLRVPGRVVERTPGPAKGRRAGDGAATENAAARPLRILLADDHQMTLAGLRNVVESQPGWSICGEARNGLEAVEKAGSLKPDIVIMDFSMPEMDGLEATRRIRRQSPGTEVLIFTMHESKTLVQEALAAGARGFMMKTEVNPQLVTIVNNLANHEIAYSLKTTALMMDAVPRISSAGEAGQMEDVALTPRECEVIRLIVKGRTCKEIGTALNISTKTADVHRTNILFKLKIHNAADLVRYAIRHKLVEP